MQTLTVTQLKAWLDSGDEHPTILDVREPWEYQTCNLSPSTLVPMREIPQRLGTLDKQADIVVLCHHGIRSLQVCRFLDNQGFVSVYNVAGGIDAWAKEIDPHMSQY